MAQVGGDAKTLTSNAIGQRVVLDLQVDEGRPGPSRKSAARTFRARGGTLFLQSHESQGQKVRLDEGTGKSVVLALIPAGAD
jgi:hypothetical protein